MTQSQATLAAIRFGYGIRPGEAVPKNAQDLLAQLEPGSSQALPFPAEGIEERIRTIRDFQARLSSHKGEDRATRRSNVRPIRKEIYRIGGVDMHARIAHAVHSPYGFYERLVAFWSDHFSVSAKKQRMMGLIVPLFEAEAIRPHVAGSFSTLLRQAILHPAMLIYLDQNKSNGPNSRRAENTGKGLNENLGRELLELHTLGVDAGYSQDDVRQASLVLTGMTVDRRTGEARFRQNFAEPGPISLFGKDYGSEDRSEAEIEEMLDDLAHRPETIAHLCRKLAVHFIADQPSEDLIGTMAAAWKKNDGRLVAVYRAMLDHPAAWLEPGQKARQPLDYVIAGLRAANVPAAALAQPDREEDGDEEADIASPVSSPVAQNPGAQDPGKSGMAAPMMMAEDDEARADREDDKAATMAKEGKVRPPANPLSIGALRRLGQPLWEPESPAGAEEGFSAWISSSQITGRIAWAHRVAAGFSGQTRPTDLLKTVLADAARADTITVVAQAPNRKSGIALVLSAPEFNRR